MSVEYGRFISEEGSKSCWRVLTALSSALKAKGISVLDLFAVVIKTYFIGIYFARSIQDYFLQICVNKCHVHHTQTNSVTSRIHSLVKSASANTNPNSVSSKATISSTLPKASVCFCSTSRGHRLGYWQYILWFCIANRSSEAVV